jgi:hypothetical protein
MSHLLDFNRFNKPHTPTEEAQAFIYQIYTLLFNAQGITPRTRQTTLETAAVNLYPWKVVCISVMALVSILNSKSTNGLRRGHPVKRADRSKRLFERASPMAMREFMDYYFANDTVALVIAGENNKHGVNHWSRLIDVPEGRLATGSFSVRLGPGDFDWVKEVCTREEIGAA